MNLDLCIGLPQTYIDNWDLPAFGLWKTYLLTKKVAGTNCAESDCLLFAVPDLNPVTLRPFSCTRGLAGIVKALWGRGFGEASLTQLYLYIYKKQW